MQIGERFVSACLCPLLVWHHAGARHRTPALGEGEAQEHTWAPCEHTHHSVSSRALRDACSVSETAGAISLQLEEIQWL